jgi:phosphomevalonate kinase
MGMIKISAPGKLFLSGEWSVLEMGNPGIVAAVNKRVWVEAEEASEISVSVDDFKISDAMGEFGDGRFEWTSELTDEQRERLIFCRGAIEAALKYLGEFKPFRIRSWGEMSQLEVDGEMKKIGFGSSAASVVAFVSAILKLNGKDIESRDVRDIIYKLSTIAHYFVQGKVGSAFDVAASTYGGVFVYKRFDPKWLLGQMESSKAVKEIVEEDWPGFEVEELEIPEGFDLLVGWTRGSASTSAMVKQMNGFKEQNPGEYKRLFDQIADLVRGLIPAWKAGDKESILEYLRKNEDYLRELGKKSGVNIETPELMKLSEVANQAGGAGKLSGAGGGDCGIAVCFDSGIAEKIKQGWSQAGLYLVDAMFDYSGTR